MIKFKSILSFIILGFILTGFSSTFIKKQGDPILDFINLKYGMFIHYNMGTYHAEQWAKPNHDPKSFAPTQLDCNQWALAAKSAKMNYAVLTTKHHDGFCLWDSSVTNYDIGSSSYQGDIVKEYVDAFRKQDIKIGLYFSVWDRHHAIEKGKITSQNITFMKKQLTELLTNYGEVVCIVIDGWGSKWGKGPSFKELPFHTLADHIHSIQPDCLVINHSCKTDLSVTQVVHYEATHGQHCPYDNTIPSQQGPTLQPTWFWEAGYEHGELKEVDDVVKELNFSNSHLSNYLLNVAPNDKGLLDDNVISRLKEIGEEVELSKPLKKLPKIKSVHKGVIATASSYESEKFKPENSIDCNLFTRWKYAVNDTDRWIELDFGEPKTFNKVICGEQKNRIIKFKIEALVNGVWKQLVEGTKMTYNFNATFEETTAQKYRLTVLETEGIPMIAELTFVKY